DLLAEARLGGNRQGPGGAGLKPAPTEAGRPHSNLPAPLTSFVGREREIAAVRRALGGARLLTLTGAGGCGKTRLALRVADELLWAYPHGVWFVELAALADPALVPRTVAAALDLQTAEPRPPVEALKEFLRPRSLLLVLDNCEHLPAACAELVETLLRACPNLEVLTTSRAPLGIGGEAVWQVPPMALPPVAWESRVHHAQGARDIDLPTPDSVRLFVARARLYRPEFDLSVTNAEAVAEVCRRLDGIPLAIELAAARVRALSVEQIAVRLEDRLRLLTGGSRTALPRHQTLRAALDWSHDLLTEEERALLRRLSVFAGGFELEAAEHVEAADVLDVLTSLVDKSLVIAEEQGGIVRYRLLETVRQYAGEKLDESGEVAATRDRHLDWYLALAQSAAGAYRGPHEPAWLTRLEQEHDNLRAALAWSLQSSKPEPALRLAGSLATFWDARGHLHEGQRWLAQALAAGAAAPVEVRAQALLGAGVLSEMIGDSAAARAFREESLGLYQRLGDRQGIASAQAHLGRITFRQGDLPAARVLFEASLAHYQELGEKPGIAEALGRLALIALRQGDNDAARTQSEARLAICRELGNRDGAADTLELLSTVAGEQGDHERQVALLEESLALYRELGNRGGIALALGSLGMAAWTRSDYDRASSLLQESLTLYRQ
ncbi:MAG: ATP-binding protein, partial [Dehalococcoidia bacterium]